MLNGVSNHQTGNVALSADTAATGASAGAGGLLNEQKDSKEASTEAKFGDVLNKIQGKYGAKPEKQREIKKTLGKDDFLRIMITQLKNQDPTSPFKAEQMATEMAQFTSVEQLQNVNQNLGKLQNAQQPLERLAMTNMIGKIVTIDRERFQHVEGQNEAVSFTLPKDASEAHVQLVSDAGEVVLDKDLGPQKAGEVSVAWDGKKNTTPINAKGGNYTLKVEAKGVKGDALQLNPMTEARVIGVTFEGAEAAFLVGDSKHQDKITMKQVIKIDDPMTAALGNPAAAGGGPVKPNFIAFQKGVGSSNLDESASPEIAEALKKFQADKAATEHAEEAQAEAAKATRNPALQAEAPGTPGLAPKQPAIKPEGFPNGLHDDQNEKGGE